MSISLVNQENLRSYAKLTIMGTLSMMLIALGIAAIIIALIKLKDFLTEKENNNDKDEE